MSEFLFDPGVGWGLPDQFFCQRTNGYAEQLILAFLPPKVPYLVIPPLSSIDWNKGQDNEKVKGLKRKGQKRAIFGLIMDWGRIAYRAGIGCGVALGPFGLENRAGRVRLNRTAYMGIWKWCEISHPTIYDPNGVNPRFSFTAKSFLGIIWPESIGICVSATESTETSEDIICPFIISVDL